MNEFIEKNSRLLRIYCVIAQVVGWLLLLQGVIYFLAGSSAHFKFSQTGEFISIIYYASPLVFDLVVPGLLAFVIAQFLAYLIRPEIKPGLMLRFADKLCYLYACAIIVKALAFNFWLLNNPNSPEVSQSFRLLSTQMLLLFPTLAKVLLLIGVGIILHRLLPVIEESKTLV